MSHGLAATIRSSVESETFDLAGQNVTTIENTIRDAFSEPFELNEMIRLTFVTGAGKLGRAKYDDGAAKAVTSTLKELDFEEDRGASAVMECAGSFKLQHDTGKNLKTVVVFPKVLSKSDKGSEQNVGSGGPGAALIAEGSIEHKIAFTSMNVFPRMIENQCITWSQKKSCVEALTALKAMVEELENKLVQGQSLTESEEEMYNSISANAIEEKMACVRDLMHKQVDAGKITADDKRTLLKQVDTKLTEFEKKISTAEKESKAKLVENLKAAETKVRSRKEKLNSIAPSSPPPIKNEAEINQLRNELVPLLEVEEASKGRLLSVKESQALARKEEIMDQIEALEEASRLWFEEDEAFQSRLDASRNAWLSRQKQSKKKTTGAKASSTSAAPAWTTTGSRKPSVSRSKAPPKKKNPGTGGLFGAMMLDDSDED